MLSILLLILKIIGITIASILGIILLLICLILFVPVRYRVMTKKDAEIYALLKVSWLLRLVYARVEYEDGQLVYVLRVFGIKIPLEKKPRKQKKEKKTKLKQEQKDLNEEQTEQEPSQETVAQEESTEPITVKSEPREFKQDNAEKTKTQINETEQRESEQSKTKQKKSRKKKTVNRKNKKKRGSFFGKLKLKWMQMKERVRRIKNKIQEILSNIRVVRSKVSLVWRFLTSDENRPGIVEIFRSMKMILKNVAPRTISADIHFGTGDPCSTGEALGVISLVHMPFADQIRLQPDFEEKVLEGEAMVAGRIQLFYMIRIAIHLYRNQQFKQLLKNFKTLKEEL